jgi:hypothetical protein
MGILVANEPHLFWRILANIWRIGVSRYREIWEDTTFEI